MTRKNISRLLGAILLLGVLALSFCSCSARWHLKRSEYHERMAIAKGAVIASDTVYIETPVPVVKLDTFVQEITTENLLYDTIRVETTRWKVKIKYDTGSNKLHVDAEAQPEPVKAPATINKQIIAPPCPPKTPWWNPVLWLLSGLFVGWVLGRVTKR